MDEKTHLDIRGLVFVDLGPTLDDGNAWHWFVGLHGATNRRLGVIYLYIWPLHNINNVLASVKQDYLREKACNRRKLPTGFVQFLFL